MPAMAKIPSDSDVHCSFFGFLHLLVQCRRIIVHHVVPPRLIRECVLEGALEPVRIRALMVRRLVKGVILVARAPLRLLTIGDLAPLAVFNGIECLLEIVARSLLLIVGVLLALVTILESVSF